MSTAAPSAGPSAGGTAVTIEGRGLLAGGGSCSPLEELSGAGLQGLRPGEPVGGCAAVLVYFGDEPGLVAYATDDRIGVLSPAHDPGTVRVTVVNRRGWSGGGHAGQFTFTGPAPPTGGGPAPQVSGVTPDNGPATGFTGVGVAGAHLLAPGVEACIECGNVAVSFGGTEVPVLEGTQSELLVAAPPHRPGTVTVLVGVTGVSSARSDAARYTFTGGHGHGHGHGHGYGGHDGGHGGHGHGHGHEAGHEHHHDG